VTRLHACHLAEAVRKPKGCDARGLFTFESNSVRRAARRRGVRDPASSRVDSSLE
jgi:hypothetical protein